MRTVGLLALAALVGAGVTWAALRGSGAPLSVESNAATATPALATEPCEGAVAAALRANAALLVEEIDTAMSELAALAACRELAPMLGLARGLGAARASVASGDWVAVLDALKSIDTSVTGADEILYRSFLRAGNQALAAEANEEALSFCEGAAAWRPLSSEARACLVAARSSIVGPDSDEASQGQTADEQPTTPVIGERPVQRRSDPRLAVSGGGPRSVAPTTRPLQPPISAGADPTTRPLQPPVGRAAAPTSRPLQLPASLSVASTPRALQPPVTIGGAPTTRPLRPPVAPTPSPTTRALQPPVTSTGRDPSVGELRR